MPGFSMGEQFNQGTAHVGVGETERVFAATASPDDIGATSSDAVIGDLSGQMSHIPGVVTDQELQSALGASPEQFRLGNPALRTDIPGFGFHVVEVDEPELTAEDLDDPTLPNYMHDTEPSPYL